MCLGSSAYFMLDGMEDAKSRINKISKSKGALKFMWDKKNAPL